MRSVSNDMTFEIIVALAMVTATASIISIWLTTRNHEERIKKLEGQK